MTDDGADHRLFVQLADLAEAIGTEAGRHARNQLGTAAIVDTKSSATDLVTEADRSTEALIVESIRNSRPDDAILGEESGRHTGSSGVTWIVDPIDGTTNFAYGLAGFDISIAAVVDARPVAGVVIDPMRHETFRATLGGGATCNGDAIHARSTVELSHALIGTGFSYRPERRQAQGEVLAQVIAHVRDIRRLGAAALDLCYVAAGRLDAYFESGLQAWDLAAGGLIASEAGCRVTGLDDGPLDGRLVIAGTPSVHDRLRSLLADLAERGLAVRDPSARVGWQFGRLEL